MWNESWKNHNLGSRLPEKNINNLGYVDNTTLMEESEEELKSFLVRLKEESEKADVKLNSEKTKIMASSHITSWQRDGKTMETVSYFIFFGFKITADSNCGHKIKRHLLLARKTDRSRLHIKKQRHHFVFKVLYSRSHVFGFVFFLYSLKNKKFGP